MIGELLGGPIPPAVILIVGGLIIPLLPHGVRAPYMLALPIVSFWHLMSVPLGEHLVIPAFGYTLTLFRFDALARIFAIVFHLAILLSVIYALHVRDTVQQVAGLVYPGAALGGLLAGDLITLFIFWEIMAAASVFLIWASRTEASYRAGLRYLAIHVLSGVLLLGGTVLQASKTGSIAFEPMALGSGLAPTFIFVAFGIKAVFPLLHNWLQDSYPKSTVTGTLILSVFTTKLAVYALARGFSGTELLIAIGATMTAFPVFFAVIENDLRRVLSYSLNNQVGFMVAAIGVGTPLALNGAVGYAFCNIIFEGLLFMAMGAVLFRTGTIKATDLGGLWRSMPYTAFFCIIGALSISAFPFFSGFVAKGMILSSVAGEGHMFAWLVLLFASAGVLEHSGIKIPYFAFFAHDSGKRVQEAPTHMLIAMAVAAALCVAIGLRPELLFAVLPFPDVAYVVYSADHILTQLQLLTFAVLAFVVLVRTGFYPAELRAINLDVDWLYRRLAPALVRLIGQTLRASEILIIAPMKRRSDGLWATIYRHHGPQGVLARTWPTGSMVLWVALILAGTLIGIYWFTG